MNNDEQFKKMGKVWLNFIFFILSIFLLYLLLYFVKDIEKDMSSYAWCLKITILIAMIFNLVLLVFLACVFVYHLTIFICTKGYPMINPPVKNITDTVNELKIGTPLILTGTVKAVCCNKTIQRKIVWHVKEQRVTGASITDGKINATYPGIVTVTATIKSGKALGEDYLQNFDITVIFTPVTDIANLSTGAAVNKPLNLTGTVQPSDATNKDIVWSIIDAENTGATIDNNIFLATSPGTAKIKGTIENGKAIGTDYSQQFNVIVIDPVTGITYIPVGARAGTPFTLTGTVIPNNATKQDIKWDIKDPGTTGANIIPNSNILNTTSPGIVTVTATIANALENGESFSDNFDITILDTTEVNNEAS